MFVERRSLVLWKSPKRIFRLHEKPVLGKVLSNLSRGPLPMDELFSKVWPARFNPIKHATHLRGAKWGAEVKGWVAAAMA